MSKVLVTGGCGYIGSHTIVDLINNGYDVVSIDNLSRSNPIILDGIEQITGKSVYNYKVDLCDIDATQEVFEAHPDISGIIHFAAYKMVGESVQKPLLYYHNNLLSLTNLLQLIKKYKVQNLVFSSSCSVYGNAEALPVTEDTPIRQAESPYAHTKQIGEEIIQNFAKSYPLNYMLLRYFNPAGAHESGHIGELPIDRPQNLVPYITKTATGELEQLSIFGKDYPTEDGTCVRDYIHVMDIGGAHTAALKRMQQDPNGDWANIYNLGAGAGRSVLDAVKTFESVNNLKLNWTFADRRPGDVVAIYANNQKAVTDLKWNLKYSFEDIMKSAYEWELVLKDKVLAKT